MTETESDERIVVQVSPRITLVADFRNESYYIDIAPLVPRAESDRLDDLLRRLGLEDMPEDECPSELLPSGNTRVWCTKIDGHA